MVDIAEEHSFTNPARVTELLSAAARLSPADLVFRLWGECKHSKNPIEIPCFERATSVKLDVQNLSLTPPTDGVDFPLLERLSVACSHIDTAELVLRCPRLRMFEVSCSGYGPMCAKIHSPTVEELGVQGFNNIDSMAPMLKRFSLSVTVARDFTVSFSAPMVENLSWYCSSYRGSVGFGEKWRLRDLKLEMKEKVGVLQMCISAYYPEAEAGDVAVQELAAPKKKPSTPFNT